MQAFDRGMEGEGASGFDIVAPRKDHHVRELSERSRERERETSVRPALTHARGTLGSAECSFDLAHYSLPFRGTMTMARRESAILELSVILSTTVIPPLTSLPSNSVLDETPTECPVCDEQFALSQMVVFQPCRHFFCHSCVTGHIETKITDGSVGSLHCLAPECPTIITPELIKTWTPELYDKYDRIAFNSALSQGNAMYVSTRRSTSRWHMPTHCKR